MAKPIKLTPAEQALIFDFWWRLRDAVEAGDLRLIDSLRLEMRELFSMNDRGLTAGREIYQQRLADANIPPNFRDLPRAQRRKLIIESYNRSLSAKTDDTAQPTKPAPRPEPTADRNSYDAWFESLSLGERDQELDRLMSKLTGETKAEQAPLPTVDDYNELVDAAELAQLRAMWGEA